MQIMTFCLIKLIMISKQVILTGYCLLLLFQLSEKNNNKYLGVTDLSRVVYMNNKLIT